VRAGDFLRQLERLEGRQSRWEPGLRDVVLGLLKKVVLADTAGVFADRVFADPGAHSAPALLLGAYAYAYQIYYDFSGYSDIAIGLAALLGFDLRQNFNYPYLATNPADFWRRWHISLSTWLRDYLYIPLGGNRNGLLLTYRNLMLTMLLGGLWHGAAWNFVLWGGYHGVLLSIHRFFTRDRAHGDPSRTCPVWMRRIGMFHLATLGWILFRIENLADLKPYFHGLLAGKWILTDCSLTTAGVVTIGLASQVLGGRFAWRETLLRQAPEVQAVTYAAATAAIVLLGQASQRFIYFQF
jgi:alginate O-acetyltransferase complex protein AlgI